MTANPPAVLCFSGFEGTSGRQGGQRREAGRPEEGGWRRETGRLEAGRLEEGGKIFPLCLLAVPVNVFRPAAVGPSLWLSRTPHISLLTPAQRWGTLLQASSCE